MHQLIWVTVPQKVQGRPEPPLAADETATLLGFLEFQRATHVWKCAVAGLRGRWQGVLVRTAS
jgi:hypothetical protein